MLDLILINDCYRPNIPYSFGKIYLSDFLTRNGWRVRLIQPWEVSKLGSNPTRFFGVGSWSLEFHHVVATATSLKQRYPGIPIICGGGHVTVCPFDLQEHAMIFDYWVLGEGEVAVHEILQGQHKTRVPIIRPVPQKDLLPPNTAHNPVSNGSYTSIASRGCPHICTFCNTHKMFGHNVRSIALDKYLQHLRDLLNQGMVTLSFRDSSFLNDIDWATGFCAAVLKEKLQFNWLMNCCAEQLTEERVLMMKRAGCIGVTIGVESGAPSILKMMKKAAGLNEMKRGISLCKKYNIHTHLNLMYGVLGETRETMAATREFYQQTKPDSKTLALYEPFPGTAMFEEAEQKKFLSPYNWGKGQPAKLLFTGSMARDEVIREADRLWSTGPFHQYLRVAKLENKLIFLPSVFIRVILLRLLTWRFPLTILSNHPAFEPLKRTWDNYRIDLIGRIQLYLYLSA